MSLNASLLGFKLLICLSRQKTRVRPLQSKTLCNIILKLNKKIFQRIILKLKRTNWPLRLLIDETSNIAKCSQYLNCKMLHGGTLLQPWPNPFGMQKHFSGIYVIPSLKSSEDQKKKERSCRKIKSFCPRNQAKTKKKVFTAIWNYILPEFGEFTRADRPLFVWLSSAQISMGGR